MVTIFEDIGWVFECIVFSQMLTAKTATMIGIHLASLPIGLFTQLFIIYVAPIYNKDVSKRFCESQSVIELRRYDMFSDLTCMWRLRTCQCFDLSGCLF